MVPQFSIIVLNVFGVIELMLPLILLFILHRRHPIKFSSIICGLAAYFIVNYLVINNVFTIIRAATGNELIFDEKVLLGLFLDAVLAALIMPPLVYFIIKTIRGGKWSLYDTITMAISYWALRMIKDSALQVSSASILQRANKGTLDMLASEEYPIEMLNALVESVNETSPFMLTVERLITILTQVIVFFCILTIMLLVFYAVKRRKKLCLWLAMAVYFVMVCLINGSYNYLGEWYSLIVIALLGACSIYFVYRFFLYYRSQQAELLKKRQQFKDEQHEKYLKELEEKKKQSRS